VSETAARGILTSLRQSDVDPITRLMGRQAFIACLEDRVARARREVVRFGVAIVDLDEFKKFNLSHGLTCGDAALRGVAEQLVRTNSTPRADAARYDGNAFAMLLESASAEELSRSAHALHGAVAKFRTTEGLALSASIGVAHARIGETAEAILMRAEQTLYLAKQFGRNRVEISASAAPLRVDGSVVALRRSA